MTASNMFMLRCKWVWALQRAFRPYGKTMTSQASKVSVAEMQAFFMENFKGDRGELPRFDHIEDGKLTLSMTTGIANMRPSPDGLNSFVSGPTQMQLADHAAYAVIFTRAGIVPMAMTTNLNIDFLRPCIGPDIIAEAEIIQLGRFRAIISVEIRGKDSAKPASRSTVTYAMPRS